MKHYTILPHEPGCDCLDCSTARVVNDQGDDMYTITISGAPYGQAIGQQYTGELLRIDIKTLAGAKRIARKALCTVDQTAHIYRQDTLRLVDSVSLAR